MNGGHQDKGTASLVVRDSFNFGQMAQLVHFLSLQEQLQRKNVMKVHEDDPNLLIS